MSCPETSRRCASVPARRLQARIEESHRRLADLRMDAAAIDAGRVDAGMWEFIPAGLAALVDEDVVVDAAGDDVKLRALGVSGGKSGILGGWRLGIGCADRDIGRHLELPQSGFIHAEGLDDAGRYRERGLYA